MSLRYFEREFMPPRALPYPLALLYGTGAGKQSMAGDAPYADDPSISPAELQLTSVMAELVARMSVNQRYYDATV